MNRLSAVRSVILAYGGIPQSMHQLEASAVLPVRAVDLTHVVTASNMQDLLKLAQEEERILMNRLSAVRSVILAYGGVPQSVHKLEVSALHLSRVTNFPPIATAPTFPFIPPFPPVPAFAVTPPSSSTQTHSLHADASGVSEVSGAYATEQAEIKSENIPIISKLNSQRRRQTSEQTKRIKEVVADIISKSGGGPVRTQHLVLMIESRGLKINGKNSVSSLSALLSNSEEFIPHGRSGWTLKQEGQEVAPPDSHSSNEEEFE